MTIHLRDACGSEQRLLAGVMIESGAYSGPDMQALTDVALGTSPTDHPITRIAFASGQIAGFYSLIRTSATERDRAELDYLLIHERWNGHGIGLALMHDLRRTALAHSFSQIKIVAHPPAEQFYLNNGATRTGTEPPTNHRTWYCPKLLLSA